MQGRTGRFGNNEKHRKDFGLNFNAALCTDKVVVGVAVTITLDVKL